MLTNTTTITTTTTIIICIIIIINTTNATTTNTKRAFFAHPFPSHSVRLLHTTLTNTAQQQARAII